LASPDGHTGIIHVEKIVAVRARSEDREVPALVSPLVEELEPAVRADTAQRVVLVDRVMKTAARE
jgi:hypothetical protein